MKTNSIDHRYLGRDTPPYDLEIAKQAGSFVFTPRGKKYLDFEMGWCVGNFGWNNPEIKKRLRQFRGPNYISPSQLYKPWAKLAAKLESVSPGKLKKSFRATGGTEAVEIALQAAMNFTKRSKFISVADAYHGDSIATRSVGSPEFGKWYKNFFSGYRIRPPLDLKAAARVATRLKKRDVAAFIMEPIICNRSVMIPEPGFLPVIAEACKQNGTLLILDEVATGFWRTGKMFATEHFEVEPDILCLGKALSGGFAPIGATLMTEEVARAMKYEDSFYSTYGWHPFSVEAALATLDYIKKHQQFLRKNIEEAGQFIVQSLATMDFAESPSISAKGLAIGVTFKKEGYGRRIVERALKRGLILAEGENGFTLFPALNASKPVIHEGLFRLQNSL